MLTYLYADQLVQNPKLYNSMFTDRAWQFRQRLKWDVDVDDTGFERDEYDDMNPLYAIWQKPDGTHGGSMRAMPTTGRCMVNEHFSNVAGRKISDPKIWESTRFCLSPDLGEQAGRISAALMLAGCEVGIGFGLHRAIGVFDPRMVRIYRRLGWPPEILGTTGAGRDKIYVGLWDFSQTVRHTLALNAGVSPQISTLWFQRAFGHTKTIAA
ncbi:UNVERIFIED_CONTAM: hypothetical protein GTU68_062462 [Idotea baltica]|nr:hypothetical protein [Idotea baltica]